MPKESTVTFDELKEAILINNSSDYFSDKNCLHPPSHEIWKTVSATLNSKMSSKYIYTFVKGNRKNILTIIRNSSSIGSLVDHHQGFHASHLKCDSQSNSDSQSESDYRTVSFNVTLSVEEWNTIRPKSVVYYDYTNLVDSGRSYTVLEPGQWTSLINDHVYEQIKVCCQLVYKRAKIYKEGTNYLVIDGSCSLCKSILKGHMGKKPELNSRAIITFTYSGDFDNCLGGSKRRLSGMAKSIALHKLIDMNASPSFIRRNEASRLMNFGDKEPSHLPTLNALRVLKSKTIKKNQVHEDPILSLSLLKNSMPYSTIIRQIGYDKFYVYYWSTVQMNAYRQYFKHTDTPFISIDATGGVVRKPTLISGQKCKSIFLYEIAIHNDQSQFPVAHMLSGRHDNNSISHWLTDWIRDGAPSPKCVVTDQSIALMSACVRSFTQYSSLAMYLEVCSSLVLNPEKYSLPTCFIRNDIAHVMKLITSWKEIKELTYRLKNFYLRAIGLVITSIKFDDAKYILQQIFTVALNETDGINITTGMVTKCDTSKTYLKKRIANNEILLLDEYLNKENEVHACTQTNDDDNDFQDNAYVRSGYSSKIYDEVCDIYDKCKIEAEENNDEGTHENMQFNPSLANKLKHFCKLLPIWSAILTTIYKYGKITESSASSESLFNDLKNRVFRHKTLPLRIDDFVQIHIKSVEGSVILSGSKNPPITSHITLPVMNSVEVNSDNNILCVACKNADYPGDAHKCIVCNASVHILSECSISIGNGEGYGEKRKCIRCYKSNYTDINENVALENWRNEALEPKKKIKRNYLDKDPTILWYNDKSKTKREIGILQNGSLSKLMPILIDKKPFIITNTCGFDSIVHALCVGMCDSTIYGQFIHKEQDASLLFKLVYNVFQDGINAQVYKKRALILKSLTKEENIIKTNEVYHINAKTSIENLIQKLFKDYPTRITTRTCANCPPKLLSSVFLISNTDDIQNIQSSIQYDEENCCICGGHINNNLKYNDHVFIITNKNIDVDKILPSNYITGVPCKLDMIPKVFNIQEKSYKLRGAIELKTGLSIESTGHFLFHSFREVENQWQTYLKKNVVRVRECKLINCEML